MGSKMSDVLQEIFKEQRDFIIIGLTGRTGSGCSTVAEILTNTLELREPDIHDTITNEERKYQIVYNFIKHKLTLFTKIKISNIITSFIFDYPHDFLKYIQTQYEIPNLEEARERYEELKKVYSTQNLHLKTIDNVDPENAFKFYFELLADFNLYLRKLLGDSFYTKIFQDLGDNLRSSGHIESDAPIDNILLQIPERTNSLIKVMEDYNESHGLKKYFVIDAIRNPFEALFFRQRYSAFYLISITSPDEHRVNRLFKKGLTLEQIESIDNKEYPKGKNNLVVINIQKCIQDADIHIQNSDSDIPYDRSNLKEVLAKYVSLMIHPGLITPTKVERCMQIAYTAKFNSGCISRQVGAIITDSNFSVKAVGWNDTPYGQTPCLLRSVNNLLVNKDKKAYSNFELKDEKFKTFFKTKFSSIIANPNMKGRNHSYCFKNVYNEFKDEDNQVYTRALHAEENAFLQLAKYGSSGIENGVLFTTASPCELCAKKAYQLEIKQIIYIDPYPGISLKHILECGTKRPSMELFSGAIGRAYHKLYEPIMPYKDEISILLE